MNVLLIEPAYKNKYPPLALMKIASYHKDKGDFVIFTKGQMEEKSLEALDRIYITTLFTFEWREIEKTILYAKTLIEANKIYIGGIAATLLADFISKQNYGINIVVGLLNEKGKLGFEDDDVIDTLPPDYTILDQIKYKYPASNAFFAYTTRGCGMNCSFCAVKTLEPEYKPRVFIKDQIKVVQDTFGRTRDLRNLLLMDNNVLKSQFLSDIVDEIVELGFGKGARYINPETGKIVRRYVDFNQGLDANLVTENTALLLAKLELRPVRIAFDHIKDHARYVRAVEICARAGLREFSNYLLYNSDEGSWKGKDYPPDTPEDLYWRLVYNLELQERLNEEIAGDERINIYSFPMRYIPLDHKERGYVGKNWNAKFLRAIQVMLNPTQGKGVSGRSFFKAAFGANEEEYRKILMMPERVMASRGWFVDKKDEDEAARNDRYKKWEQKNSIWKEWERLYDLLTKNEEESEFLVVIQENRYTVELYYTLQSEIQKKIYLYYLSETKLMELLDAELESGSKQVYNYLLASGKFLHDMLVDYIYEHNPSYKKIHGFIHIFGRKAIDDYIKKMINPSNLSGAIGASLVNQWMLQYEKLDDVDHFHDQIIGNVLDLSCFSKLNCQEKRAFVYYLTPGQLIDLLGVLESEKDITLLYDYCTGQVPEILEIVSEAILAIKGNIPQKYSVYVNIFGRVGINTLLLKWIVSRCDSNMLLPFLQKSLQGNRRFDVDIDLLYALKEYVLTGILNEEFDNIIKFLEIGNHYKLRELLIKYYPLYSEACLRKAPEDDTRDAWLAIVNKKLSDFYQHYLTRLL